mmetsp:Transcript_2900/g.5948  ORF Transcript_2900/g.5948 Transcript_2900/m.5948 type:complete len:219 (+) Transcript_2900:1342-1998(+)
MISFMLAFSSAPRTTCFAMTSTDHVFSSACVWSDAICFVRFSTLSWCHSKFSESPVLLARSAQEEARVNISHFRNNFAQGCPEKALRRVVESDEGLPQINERVVLEHIRVLSFIRPAPTAVLLILLLYLTVFVSAVNVLLAREVAWSLSLSKSFSSLEKSVEREECSVLRSCMSCFRLARAEDWSRLKALRSVRVCFFAIALLRTLVLRFSSLVRSEL